MPKEIEEKLKLKAKKRGLSKKRTAAYVYGTLRKTSWKPKKEKDVTSSRNMPRNTTARKRITWTAEVKYQNYGIV